MPPRSLPAEKHLPAPRTTTKPTRSIAEPICPTCASSSANKAGVNAFSFSGRLSVKVAKPSLSSRKTNADITIPPLYLSWTFAAGTHHSPHSARRQLSSTLSPAPNGLDEIFQRAQETRSILLGKHWAAAFHFAAVAQLCHQLTHGQCHADA